MCYVCNQPGVVTGWWHSPIRRIRWTCYRCDNPACRFSFKSALDGRAMAGKPTWMEPPSIAKARAAGVEVRVVE